MEYVINYKRRFVGCYDANDQTLTDNEDVQYSVPSFDEALKTLYEVHSKEAFTGTFKQMQWIASLRIQVSNLEQ